MYIVDMKKLNEGSWFFFNFVLMRESEREVEIGMKIVKWCFVLNIKEVKSSSWDYGKRENLYFIWRGNII